MTKKHIAALTIALLIAAGTEAEAQTTGESLPSPGFSVKKTGNWLSYVPEDEWGDTTTDKRKILLIQYPQETLITAGGKSETVTAEFVVHCYLGITIRFGSLSPNLWEDWTESGVLDGRYDEYRVPSKIDGIKGHTYLWVPVGQTRRAILVGNPKNMTKFQETLEILFAWGRDGQRQSLTLSKDGFSEAYAEACGEELEAAEKALSAVDPWGAQPGEWKIYYPTDQWGETDSTGIRIKQIAMKNTDIKAKLGIKCDRGWSIEFGIKVNLRIHRKHKFKDSIYFQYSVPSKIDGIKGHTYLWGPEDPTWYLFGDRNPDKITEVQESLEVLFSWDGHGQQSLAWSMDGLSEAFAEACGEELDAEGE